MHTIYKQLAKRPFEARGRGLASVLHILIEAEGSRALHRAKVASGRRGRQRPRSLRGCVEAADAAPPPLGDHEGVRLVPLPHLLCLVLLPEVFDVAFLGVDVVQAPPPAELGLDGSWPRVWPVGWRGHGRSCGCHGLFHVLLMMLLVEFLRPTEEEVGSAGPVRA